MKIVGAYTAKTHFGQLLDDVEAGEEVTITRNGKTVARLIPVERNRDDVRRAVDEFFAEMAPHPFLHRIDYTGRLVVKPL